MSSKGFSPWIPTVILGVLTILFALYALQSQTQLIKVRKEAEQYKLELDAARTESEKHQTELKEALRAAEEAKMVSEELMKRYVDKPSNPGKR